MNDYCITCWNTGSIIGYRGNVVPCPMKCEASKKVVAEFKAQSETWAALGLKSAGESQVMPHMANGKTMLRGE